MAIDKFRLEELTTQLLLIVKEANTQFAKAKEDEQYEFDFYKDVQPFTQRVDKLIEEWQPLAIAWLESEKAKYLYHQQIQSTAEHLKTMSVLVFQPKASKKRVIEMVKSIRYVLWDLHRKVRS